MKTGETWIKVRNAIAMATKDKVKQFDENH